MGFKPDDPQAIPTLMGLGKTVASTAGATAQYGTEAGTAQTNAELARLNAKEVTEQGDQQAAIYGRAFAQAYGQKGAELAGSGVDTTKGSAFSSLADMTKGGALDIATIRNNAANKAFGFDQEANQYDLAAKEAKIKQGAALGSGLLTGGLQWLKWSQKNASQGEISPEESAS